MSTPDKTLVMRPGALVVRTPAAAPARPTRVYSAGYHQKHVLMADIARMEQAGEIERLRRKPLWNQDVQLWEIPVRVLREPRRRMSARRKAAIVAGIVIAFLAGMFAAGWWLLTALNTAAFLTFAGAVLAGLVLLMLAGRRSSGGGTVTATAVAVASVTVRR